MFRELGMTALRVNHSVILRNHMLVILPEPTPKRTL